MYKGVFQRLKQIIAEGLNFLKGGGGWANVPLCLPPPPPQKEPYIEGRSRVHLISSTLR